MRCSSSLAKAPYAESLWKAPKALNGVNRLSAYKDPSLCLLDVPPWEGSSNVLGQPVDGKGEVTTEVRHSIHRSAPAYVALDTTRAIFETGIKVVDSCGPYLSVVGRLACLVAPGLVRRSSSWN